jgi:predicted MFS family arabinose efflux permease
MFLMGLGRGAMDVHLNLYLRSRGLDEAAIGRILSAGSAGVLAISLPAALLTERIRPGRLFHLSATGFAACLLLLVLVPPHPALLMGLSFLVGALFTVHWVAEGPFFFQSEGPEHRTELFGIAHALETVATILTAWCTGVAAEALARRLGSESAGLRWAIGGAAVASLLAILPYRRIRTPAAPGPRKGWRDYVIPRQARLVFRLTLPAFLIGCGAGLTIPFLNLYFRDRFHVGAAPIGGLFAVSQLLMVGGYLAGPMLARRFGHVRTVVATELLSLPFFFLMAVTDQLEVAAAAFWMRAALMNMNHPVSAAFSMEQVDPDQRTVLNSIRGFAWNLSWMVTAAVGGWIIKETGGYAASMFATIGLYLSAAGLFWWWFRGKEGKKAEAPE